MCVIDHSVKIAEKDVFVWKVFMYYKRMDVLESPYFPTSLAHIASKRAIGFTIGRGYCSFTTRRGALWYSRKIRHRSGPKVVVRMYIPKGTKYAVGHVQGYRLTSPTAVRSMYLKTKSRRLKCSGKRFGK
jgi:hypothetical protein